MNAKGAIKSVLGCGACPPQQTRSEQKFQAIVEAAERVFIQLGYQKTSMDKIAQEAQVSKRTVYNHFTNKNELFLHILSQIVDEFIVGPVLSFDPDQPLAEQLTSILEAEWDLCTSERIVKLKRVILAEYITTPKFIDQFLNDLNKQESSLSKWLHTAVEAGKIQPIDLEYAYELLTGSIRTFTHDPLLFDQETVDDAKKQFIIGEIVGMFLQRYGI